MERTGSVSLKRKLLTNSERMEMLGCIIDIFEDWLEEKGVTAEDIPNDEREEEEDNGAIIYGSDYDYLTSQIEALLMNAGLLKMKCPTTGNECQMCVNRCLLDIKTCD